MSFSTRNPALLQVGQTYTFTRALNGFSYRATFTGTSQQQPPYQEAQYLGNSAPLETVYEFVCDYPNGSRANTWVWSHDVADGIYRDGTWQA